MSIAARRCQLVVRDGRGGSAFGDTLPAAVRHLWLDLVAYAAASETPGVFRFAGPVSASVSILLSVAETDVEAALKTLADRGWVERGADGRTLKLTGDQAHAGRWTG